MAGDAGDVKRVESRVEASDGARTAVQEQTAPGKGSAAPWTRKDIGERHKTNQDLAGWKPAENLANVPANMPIYRAAAAALIGDLNPGAPGAVGGGTAAAAAADKVAAAGADRGLQAMGDAVSVANMGRGPDAVHPGAAQPVDAAEQQKKVEAMLQRPENQKLAEQVSQMRDKINKMQPPSSRETARQGLEQMLARGLDGPHDISAPKLDTQKITDTLGNLNRAMGADAQHLSPLMGNDQPPAAGFSKSEREMNRDLIVAQALRNYGDTRGVQQTEHQTCLLDGKIGDQARLSPDASSKVIADAVTSKNGRITMADGHTQVKLNDSFMRPDGFAWHSTGGENAQGMSGDVRLLTGVYANALTQQRGQEFRMSADGAGRTAQNDYGDRLIDMKTGRALAVGADGSTNLTGTGRYLDSPNVGLNDSLRLNAMTGDHGMVVSNQKWEQRGVTPSDNYRNVDNAGDLQKAFAASNGSVQVGLNAHILFGSGGVGAEGGGHLTSINGMSADGKMVHIQDTNIGTSGWYSTDRVVAAITDNKAFDTTPRQGEDAAILSQGPQRGAPDGRSAPERAATPGKSGGAGVSRGGVSTDGTIVHGGGFTPSTMPDTVTNPRGMLDGTQRDDNLKNAKQETDSERQTREQQQKDQEEKNRAALWKMMQQQEKERRDREEEAERRRKQGMPN